MMNISKFKIISLVFCFFIALCSVSQGMDDPFDKEESDYPQVSWGSYLMSPFKTTLQMANNVTHYVIHNPKKSILMGLIAASQGAQAAIEYYACVCLVSSPIRQATITYYTNYTNQERCDIICVQYCHDSVLVYDGHFMTHIGSQCYLPYIPSPVN